MSIDKVKSQELHALSEVNSLLVVATLSQYLYFDRDLGSWQDMRHVGPPYGEPFPYIVSTPTGKKLALSILQQRGYQWWKQRT